MHAQYKEELIENQICFNAYIVTIGELDNYFGHFEYDAKGALYKDDFDNFPKLNQKADFYLDNDVKFVNGMIKNIILYHFVFLCIFLCFVIVINN